MDKYFKKFIWHEQSLRSLSPSNSFLNVVEFQVKHLFSDNSFGPYYKVEAACPPCLDAVVLVIFTTNPTPKVLLRKGIRPAAALRTIMNLPMGSDTSFPSTFWELPAGGVEASDWQQGQTQALSRRAHEEGWEETGLQLEAGDFFSLGPSPFPTAAFSPERLHFMAISLPHDLTPMQHPPGDGHPMEEGSSVQWVSLSQARQWCQDGTIVDSKTELGIWRLLNYLNKA